MRGRYGIRYWIPEARGASWPAMLALIAAHEILADLRGSATFGGFRDA